ncbi:hypothetical protein SIN8267_01403 [Sinobacterium norvegicum]|uniref:Integrase n=1 Tax=Sinobacterium norvegicum TaxID=1641715 RepID=A0ABN8EMI4_9GAMM|nr:hypothetical protein [Sinobacterium norvegicum]CAH0991301.1 hypothetical protein SIN8267_01403 [Sinobacterium norvegicum]
MADSLYCSVNTQKIALNALVYLYKRFMGLEISNLQFHPAKQYQRLPVVYSRDEIRKIFLQLTGTPRLMVELLYGSGLRSITSVMMF